MHMDKWTLHLKVTSMYHKHFPTKIMSGAWNSFDFSYVCFLTFVDLSLEGKSPIKYAFASIDAT